MKKFKKVFAVALTLALVFGAIGVQNSLNGGSVVWAVTEGENPEGGEVTPEPTETPEKEAKFVVWANGKDVKANEAKKIKEAFYKTDKMEYAGPYAGGKWAVVVTTADIDDETKFLALFDKPTEKAKLNTKADPIVKGKALASAKLANGVITVTAGKADAETAFNVWLYEIRKEGKNTVVVNGKVAGVDVKPVKFTGLTKVASSTVTVSEKDTDAYKKADGVKKVELSVGDSKSVYIADKNAALSATATFEVAVDSKSTDYITATLGDNGKIDITVKANKNGKKVSAKINIVNKESGKKGTFTVDIKETATPTTPVDPQSPQE